MKIEFASKSPKNCKQAIEELLFFNPSQHKVREGIVKALEKYGHPRVEETESGLSVRVGNEEAQTLFAFDASRRTRQPVGVVVFLRTTPTDISIMHVAVNPDYALKGTESGVGLGVELIEKVKEISARIVGVERIVFFYRQQVVIRVR